MLSGTVLVPGITSVASTLFEPLLKQLESIGVKTFSALDIPSVNPTARLLPNALGADVAAIRVALTEAIEGKGLDVALVGHSYGGVPCLVAAEGLWKTVRERKGKKGGVVNVALIAAPIVLAGETVGGLRQDYEKQFGVVEAPPPEFEQTDMVRPPPDRDVFAMKLIYDYRACFSNQQGSGALSSPTYLRLRRSIGRRRCGLLRWKL